MGKDPINFAHFKFFIYIFINDGYLLLILSVLFILHFIFIYNFGRKADTDYCFHKIISKTETTTKFDSICIRSSLKVFKIIFEKYKTQILYKF